MYSIIINLIIMLYFKSSKIKNFIVRKIQFTIKSIKDINNAAIRFLRFKGREMFHNIVLAALSLPRFN